jgi:serine/threonine protein kinase
MMCRMYDVFESDSELFIVMECCNGGELFDRIKTQGNFSERVRQSASLTFLIIVDDVTNDDCDSIANNRMPVMHYVK